MRVSSHGERRGKGVECMGLYLPYHACIVEKIESLKRDGLLMILPRKGIASKGHVKNVDSYDNPERVMLSLVLASPMRKSTFPLVGS